MSLALCGVICVLNSTITVNAQIGKRPRNTVPPPPTTAKGGSALPAGWQQYQFDAAKFSAAFPAKPEEEAEQVNHGGGLRSTTRSFITSNDAGVFMVAYMSELPINAERMPAHLRQSFYEGMWKGVVDGFREGMKENGLLYEVKVLGGRPVSVGGLDGREQDFMLGPLVGKCQMTLTGQRGYLILTLLGEDASENERAYFFNSFKIQNNLRR